MIQKGLITTATPEQRNRSPVRAGVKDGTYIALSMMGLNMVDNMAAAALDPEEEKGAVVREAYPYLLPIPRGAKPTNPTAVGNGRKGKVSHKLSPDDQASGNHTTFKHDNYGHIYKYETYEKTSSGHYNPVKRFDGGKPDGSPGRSHINKQTRVEIPTPHIQGKRVPGGARVAKPSEIPNNKRFNNGG